MITTGSTNITDFIGNHDAFNEQQFSYDEEKNVYHCDQDTFDWWNQVVNDQHALQERIKDLIEVYGSEAVNEVVARAVDVELEYQAYALGRTPWTVQQRARKLGIHTLKKA